MSDQITPLAPNGISIDPQEQYTWNTLTEHSGLIKEMDTPDVDQEGKALNKVISGIPSPLGRMLMFQYAIENISFDNRSAQKASQTGIAAFYGQVMNEWRALLATIAIHGDKLRTQKISLTSSLNIDDAYHNPFEMKAGLGNMLFEDEDIWCDLDTNPEDGEDKVYPFIQVIFYQHDKDANPVLIGGTSPYSLVFTPPEVEWLDNPLMNFYNKNSNKWIDPMKTNLSEKQVQAIYDTVSFAYNHLGKFTTSLNRNRTGDSRLRHTSLGNHLEEYLKDIESYARKERFRVNKYNIFASTLKFQPPFSHVFNAEAKLYYDLQHTHFYRDAGDGDYFPVNPSEFFAPSDTIVQVVSEDTEALAASPSYLLACAGEYFALPLSETGLCVFEKTLDQLLVKSNEKEESHFLYAERTDDGIKVTLDIKFFIQSDDEQKAGDHDVISVSKTYSTAAATRMDDEHIVVWPNFVSKNWKKYFLYSDIPYNNARVPVTIIPLSGDVTDLGLTLRKSKGDSYLLEKGANRVGDDDTNPRLPNLIVTPSEGSKILYEVFESDSPFKGVEICYGEGVSQKVAGYLIAKSQRGESLEESELKIIDNNAKKLREAVVGVDFGSNNTAFSYFIDNKELKLVTLNNRRHCLLGTERKKGDSDHIPADVHELFFFSKEPIEGQVKSMLVAHNHDRVIDFNINRKRAVRGGLPLFEKNIPIKGKASNNGSTNYEILMRGAESALLKYNMKWDTGDEIGYKSVFLKGLWLQIVAELYEAGYYPKELKWAVPGAMPKRLISRYRGLWEDVLGGDSTFHPIVIENDEQKSTILSEPMTEGEAVARYALNTNSEDLPGAGLSPGPGVLVIGLDVGGSTTDILMAIDGQAESETVKLIKEGSILMSASAVGEAAMKSYRMRMVMQEYVKANKKIIHQYGIDNITEDTASFHLNTLFDRLSNQDLKTLYINFYQADSKETFAITAFVTGAILFYTGQMVAHVIERQHLEIDRFALGVFGKGGNIFNWLPSVAGVPEADSYYKKCFWAGLNQKARVGRVENGISEGLSKEVHQHLQNTTFGFTETTKFTTKEDKKVKHNKSEVAFGLSSPLKLSKSEKEDLIPEIVGEKGYRVKREGDEGLHLLSDLDIMDPAYIKNFGNKSSFQIPTEFVELKRFVEVYANFVKEWELVQNAEKLRRGVDNLPKEHFAGYVIALPQFREAKNESTSFEFPTSMFMLEAKCFMDKILMPSLFN